MTFTCDICNTKVTNKSNLEKHKKTETCKRIKKDLEYEQKIKKLEEENKSLNIENILLKDENKLLTEKIKTLKEKSEEYRSIVEKAAIKSTTTVNNNSKNTYNNNLQYISSEPIKWNEIPKMLSEVVNVDTVCYDENDFHDHIIDNILKDENGNDKVLCTDINRKNFSYKDETSGELISDPELEKLREQLRNGVDIKIIRKELINFLTRKYENRPDVDIYEKYYLLTRKLDFGNPFVSRAAKKTYIKTKSTGDPLSLTE
jgi:hypothetical protein